ncbi:MAG: hypothetical protein A3B10_00875 [Candidatus Doudnabacteria bacterium RIFCSPLOWO2_01_FULL_44_21]|uniref:Uncharacterized protein n=1 Tax=Candidatus Doudnabacteria bacterium RIFCSPLOWO2_01_FULL_44_21 TaxID=1817841 RepID=A0A1F5PX73_9BACT|nr:MAG: hypothetical protein A3B10_00875 [Candidatus Doudnabacteria bacterium RIFCSPLOWO2_01_FULL_44_21]
MSPEQPFETSPNSESDLPPWLRGPGVKEEMKDWFRVVVATTERVKEEMSETADHYVKQIEKAESPGKRKTIILCIMAIEQFERNRQFELMRPDPNKTPEETKGEVEDLERKINMMRKNVGLEQKYPIGE